MTHEGTGIAGAMDHVAPDGRREARCFVCDAGLGSPPASVAARFIPGAGFKQVCSAQCASDPKFSGQARDPIVEEVRGLLLERSQVGLGKYGVPLSRDDIDLAGWLRHLRDELLDGACYAQRAIRDLERRARGEGAA